MSNDDYSTTIVRTQALVSIAEKASHISGMYTKGLFPNAFLTPHAIGMSCENFLSAFYRVWILATLRLGETIKERVESTENEELKDMMAVVPSLVIDCANHEKIYLGIGHQEIVPEVVYPRIFYLENRPNFNCQLTSDWAKAMLEIIEAHGAPAGMVMANELRGNPMRMQIK